MKILLWIMELRLIGDLVSAILQSFSDTLRHKTNRLQIRSTRRRESSCRITEKKGMSREHTLVNDCIKIVEKSIEDGDKDGFLRLIAIDLGTNSTVAVVYGGKGKKMLKMIEFGVDDQFLRTGLIAVRLVNKKNGDDVIDRVVEVFFGTEAQQKVEDQETTFTLLKDFKRCFAFADKVTTDGMHDDVLGDLPALYKRRADNFVKQEETSEDTQQRPGPTDRLSDRVVDVSEYNVPSSSSDIVLEIKDQNNKKAYITPTELYEAIFRSIQVNAQKKMPDRIFTRCSITGTLAHDPNKLLVLTEAARRVFMEDVKTYTESETALIAIADGLLSRRKPDESVYFMIVVVDVGGTSTDEAAAAVFIDAQGKVHIFGVKTKAKVIGGSNYTHALLKIAVRDIYDDESFDEVYSEIINHKEFGHTMLVLDNLKVSIMNSENDAERFTVVLPDVDFPENQDAKVRAKITRKKYIDAIAELDRKIANEVRDFVKLYHAPEDAPDAIVLVGMPCLWDGIKNAIADLNLTSNQNPIFDDNQRIIRLSNRDAVATGAFINAVFKTNKNTLSTDSESEQGVTFDIIDLEDDDVVNTLTPVPPPEKDAKFEEMKARLKMDVSETLVKSRRINMLFGQEIAIRVVTRNPESTETEDEKNDPRLMHKYIPVPIVEDTTKVPCNIKSVKRLYPTDTIMRIEREDLIDLYIKRNDEWYLFTIINMDNVDWIIGDYADTWFDIGFQIDDDMKVTITIFTEQGYRGSVQLNALMDPVKPSMDVFNNANCVEAHKWLEKMAESHSTRLITATMPTTKKSTSRPVKDAKKGSEKSTSNTKKRKQLSSENSNANKRVR